MLEQKRSTCHFPDVNRIILQILLETTRHSSDEREEIKLESVAMACHLKNHPFGHKVGAVPHPDFRISQ